MEDSSGDEAEFFKEKQYTRRCHKLQQELRVGGKSGKQDEVGSFSFRWNADQSQILPRLRRKLPARFGNLAFPGYPHQADCHLPQGRHRRRDIANSVNSHLRIIFSKGHISHPMRPIFDLPMTAKARLGGKVPRQTPGARRMLDLLLPALPEKINHSPSQRIR
jgi:hypothetical protein